MLDDRFTWLGAGVLDPAGEGRWVADTSPEVATGEDAARGYLPSTR